MALFTTLLFPAWGIEPTLLLSESTMYASGCENFTITTELGNQMQADGVGVSATDLASLAVHSAGGGGQAPYKADLGKAA